MSSALSSGEVIFQGNLTWSNSAPQNTAGVSGGNGWVDIALPTALQRDALYTVAVTNASADSALTVVVQNAESFTGLGTKYPELVRFSVAANNPDGKIALVQGFLLGTAGRIVATNDTVLSAGGGFISYIVIRKV